MISAFTFVGYLATIYAVISVSVAIFLLGTRQAYLKGFTKLRIARWFLTIPLIVLEELLMARKDRK